MEMSTKGLRYGVIARDSAFWHLVVLRGFTPLLQKAIQKAFPKIKFTRADEVLLRSNTTCFFHAITLVYYATKLRKEFKNKKWSDEERYLGFHPLGRRSCELFLAYLTQDFFYLLWNYKHTKSTESLVHHFVYILIAGYNLPNHYWVYPYMWLTLGESSTPFVSIRWLLSHLKLEKTRAYTVNGLCLLSAFFVTRVVMFYHGLKDLWRTRKIWEAESKTLRYVFVGLCLMFGLNNFWFYKILKGAMKALKQ